MLGSDICLVIAGNKIDLEKQRTVPVEEADEYVLIIYYFPISNYY